MSNVERQKIYRIKKKIKRLALTPILCACGCGEFIPPINSMDHPSQFKRGHNAKVKDYGGRFQKGQEPWNKGKPYSIMKGNQYGKILKGRLGKSPSSESRQKMSIAHKGKPSSNKGKPVSPETRAKISATLKGRKLPPERIRSGFNNHNWRGGVSTLPYGPGFTRRFKRLIRERDGHKCQRCGKTREQNWRSLEVHHIDHDKMNNNPINLITVCSSCNIWLSYHRDEIPQ